MQSVGLFEAWSLWWQGKSVQGMSLWGMPMLVVGRVGKIMAFAGSVVAVIDIIGPTRIREWGARTKRANPQKLTERIQENPHYVALTLAFAVAGSVIALSAFFGAGLGLLADAILAILATVNLMTQMMSTRAATLARIIQNSTGGLTVILMVRPPSSSSSCTATTSSFRGAIDFDASAVCVDARPDELAAAARTTVACWDGLRDSGKPLTCDNTRRPCNITVGRAALLTSPKAHGATGATGECRSCFG